jgi:ectoine hydroxylase-related dioxygenase (phytanoyl-CoA dioxygenase family)
MIPTDRTLCFANPDWASVARRAGYSESAIDHARLIESQGYTVVKSGVSPHHCSRAIDAFRSWLEQNKQYAESKRMADGHYPRFVNFHSISDTILDLFADNRTTLEIQDVVFGGPAAVYTSLFYERGSAQPLHRDVPYFCTYPRDLYLGVWTALEAASLANGPLMMIPGGHAVAQVDPVEVATAHFGGNLPNTLPPIHDGLWVAYQSRVSDECFAKGLNMVVAPLDAGDTLIWHPLLPHGGAQIVETHLTRFSIVFHTTPENVPVYQGDVFFSGQYPKPPELPRWAYRRYKGRSVADLAGGKFG